jgi:NAD(P)-dependent dehydrogenase (short-subunit alcohol dehydrogenase family)
MLQSSRGIGQALAKRLAATGARLVLADVESGADVRLADGTLARFVRTDVGSESDVQALVDSVLASEGQIDLFDSNARIPIEMGASAAGENRCRCGGARRAFGSPIRYDRYDGKRISQYTLRYSAIGGH